jgi:hypothetical protein
MLAPGDIVLLAQQAEPQVMTTTTSESVPPAPKIPGDQLDSLVAPIALYPDPLLAQTLAASTYPLEMIQLQQWMERNKDLKDKALSDAVAKQPWDPSVQSMVAFPDVVQRLSGNIQWTTDLGNAFLAQQSDVMDAVQRMRGKAENKGALKTSAQQTVETKSVEGGKQVIVIEPADPEVVYVPSYDPTVVYGAPAYPYPSYYYPGYVAGAALTFGAGLALGAAWNGGHWGDCDWNGGDVNINNNNNFNRNTNINRGQGNRGQGSGKWQHNPQHRGNAPYGDRGTANKYGGRARGEQAGGANRPGAGNRPGGGSGNIAGNRPGGGAGANRPGGGAGNRPGGSTGANRPGGGKPSSRPANRPSSKPSSRPSGGGDRVGNRSVASSPRGGGGNSAFSGGRGGGYNGGSARASSSRGGKSMGGGGMSRGGGGRGGGGRRR